VPGAGLKGGKESEKKGVGWGSAAGGFSSLSGKKEPLIVSFLKQGFSLGTPRYG